MCGGCIHFFGTRFVTTFCRPPAPPISQSLPAGKALRLTVTVVRCAGLKKSDLFGKSDPYVIISGANIVARRTTTVENGGSSPAWGALQRGAGEAGERLQIELPLPSSGPLCVRCFDADLTGSDELLGQTWITLPAPHELIGLDTEGWHGLTLQGSPAGKIYLRLSCLGPRDEADIQSVKACRCACTMRREVQKLGGAVGLRLEAGIGIASVKPLLRPYF